MPDRSARCMLMTSKKCPLGWEKNLFAIGGPGDRTHNGTNHPIRHWQAMEGDQRRLGCRGAGTIGILIGKHAGLIVPFTGQWAA
jgi:hypothetical protein